MQPLYRATVGRSRELRGSDGMEMGIVAVVIAVVMIMAAGFGERLIPMVQTLSAVSLASGPAYSEIIYHAVHGRWPPADDPTIIAGNHHGSYVSNLRLGKDGVISAQLAIGAVAAFEASSATDPKAIHGGLSFRPELLGSRDAPTITFLCGYAQPVADSATTSGTNMTTLDKQPVPPFCR